MGDSDQVPSPLKECSKHIAETKKSSIITTSQARRIRNESAESKGKYPKWELMPKFPWHKSQSSTKKAPLPSRTDTTGSSVPRNGFLSLPGEIRNMIYTLVLAEDAGILIDIRYGRTHRPTHSGYVKVVASSQPALTPVSRQLRQETLQLYYEINHFYILIPDLDIMTVYNGWANHLGNGSLTNLVVRSNFEHYVVGNPSWRNYMKYLKAVQSQKVDPDAAAKLVSMRPLTFPEDLRLTLIEMAAFTSLARDRPWKEVKQSLCPLQANWYEFGVRFRTKDWRLREYIWERRPSLRKYVYDPRHSLAQVMVRACLP